MVKCYVCGADINFRGWASHVKKEKRIHGEDIYKILKAERDKLKPKDSPKEQKPLKRKDADMREWLP